MLFQHLNFSKKYLYQTIFQRFFSNKKISIPLKLANDEFEEELICSPQIVEDIIPPDCPTTVKPPEPFIDVCIPKIEKKLIFPPDCPEPCEPPPGPIIPLCRLKRKPLIFPKIKCKVREKCPERSDIKVVFKRKKLPPLPKGDCPCVEDVPLRDPPPLKRLTKPILIQTTVCPVKQVCQPRADHGLKVIEKVLPCLKPSNCPCIEPHIFDVPPLRRLKPKPVVLPPRICKKVEVCDRNVRDEPIVPRKRLPYLKPSNCPCIEEPPLKSICPLPRLPKFMICPEPIKCAVIEECPPRADIMCGYKIKEKSLPTMLLCESLNQVSLAEYNSTKAEKRKKLKK